MNVRATKLLHAMADEFEAAAAAARDAAREVVAAFPGRG